MWGGGHSSVYHQVLGLYYVSRSHVLFCVVTDVRQQLTEQLRCLDQRVDCHLGLVSELQEYYRRHAEVEAELSRGLDKVGKQISARHKTDKQRYVSRLNLSIYGYMDT